MTAAYVVAALCAAWLIRCGWLDAIDERERRRVARLRRERADISEVK